MQIADISGADQYPVLGQSAKSAVDAVNAKGGISGHPIDLTTCDAQSGPNTAEACARQAVSAHDVAVVGTFTLGVAAVLPVLTAAKIPYIPADAFDPPEFTSANSFPVQAATSTIAGLGYIAGKNCASSVIVNVQDPEDAYDSTLINAGLKAEGKPAAKTIIIPFAPGDYSVQASQVSATKTACVIAVINPPNALAFYPALSSTGSKQHIVAVSGDGMSKEVVTKVGSFLNGSLLADYYPAYTSSLWSAYRAATAKYSDPVKYDFSNSLAEGAYVDMLLFEDAATKVVGSKETVTAATMQTELDHETAFNAGGLLPSLNFTKSSSLTGQPRLFNAYIATESVKNGTIVPDGSGFRDMTSIFKASQG